MASGYVYPFPQFDMQPPDYLVTYVINEANADVHAFVPETLELALVTDIADNFSRCVQQPVKVFYDQQRKKFRLCPLPETATLDTSNFGLHILSCDQSDPEKCKIFEAESETSSEEQVDPKTGKRIPRPCNSWILFRRLKSKEIGEQTPGLTASTKSSMISQMWANLPAEEREF